MRIKRAITALALCAVVVLAADMLSGRPAAGDGGRAATGEGANAFVAEGQRATALAAGDTHTCTLRSDGTARCWGLNLSGQLGDGQACGNPCTTPVTVSGLSGAVAIAAGDVHTCALISNGSVRCWGENFFGQLGDGTMADRSTPVTVSGLTNAVAISAGASHTCALRSDGTGRCWGSNTDGKLGDSTTTDRTTPVSVSGLTNAVAITAGGAHTCALRSDGTARCWGDNSTGQLGDSTTTDRHTPVSVSGLTNAVAIAAGTYHTCALRSDGTGRCWGSHVYGQLGAGLACDPLTYCTTPITVSGLNSAIAIAAGGAHTCALRSDGTGRCWGQNSSGQLGDGTATAQTTASFPVSGLTNAVAFAAGVDHTCALRSDGTARCWGNNSAGNLGDGTTTGHLTPVTVSGLTHTGHSSLAAGNGDTCVLLADGAARCWGSNTYGQLGDGTNVDSIAPVAVSSLMNGVAITARVGHSCALLSDGTGRCWGRNGNGQLGDGTTTNRTTPVIVSGLTNAIAIAAGAFHTCALRSDGSARCWGQNQFGALGDGTTGDSTTQVVVSGLTNAVAIAAGADHTCALLGDGTVRCWGRNTNGQLGDGQVCGAVGCTSPVVVSGLTNAVAITAGAFHTCALLSNGGLSCWGLNADGQLGDLTTTTRTTPVSVFALASASVIAAGDQHTCALFVGLGTLCWGDNLYGQVGDGTTTDRTSPVTVSGMTDAVRLATGGGHTCAVRVNGLLSCWGYNLNSQLGDGTTLNRTTPVTVIIDTDRDGCTDAAEQQTTGGSQTTGGRRSLKNFWDFFDVWTHPMGMPLAWERTKTVTLTDITSTGGIASRFATVGSPAGNPLTPPTSDTGYHVAYDRTAPAPNAWNSGPPDGAIGLNEIYWAGGQFAHNCN